VIWILKLILAYCPLFYFGWLLSYGWEIEGERMDVTRFVSLFVLSACLLSVLMIWVPLLLAPIYSGFSVLLWRKYGVLW
jgi:hypothetical protein